MIHSSILSDLKQYKKRNSGKEYGSLIDDWYYNTLELNREVYEFTTQFLNIRLGKQMLNKPSNIPLF